MRGKLIYNLPEEQEEFSIALNGWKYKHAIEIMWQIMFRPRHKHGYPGEAMEKLFESEPSGEGPLNTLMDEMEKLYHQACEDLPKE